jgi:hypothetical protein
MKRALRLGFALGASVLCWIGLRSIPVHAAEQPLFVKDADVSKYWVEYEDSNEYGQSHCYVSDGQTTCLNVKQPPLYPPLAVRAHVSACFGFNYRIDSDGRLSDIEFRRSYLSRAGTDEMKKLFQKRLISMLEKNRKYVPSIENSARREIRSYMVFSFYLKDLSVSAEELKKMCEIPEAEQRASTQ